MIESQWTEEEAQAWASSLKRATSRRFRLEGSLAGNSRLVSETQVHQLKTRFGGEIVELILRREPRLSKRRQAAIGLGVCPHCHALSDAPCLRPDQTVCAPHAKRKENTDVQDD